MSSTNIPRVVPAQLSFLAIYNPSLGHREEDFHQQIVFYYSKAAKTRSKLKDGDKEKERELREQENEKLRQVGLAQGMVGFAKSFSNGEAVDSVETQKSRIVLHELESGWWILASIDLTQLPAANSALKSGAENNTEPAIEYSSREVSPPALLIQQLVRAQTIFLLHHGTTLEAMWYKHGRAKFCNILEAYWSRFAMHWDVLLHGSPAVDIYNGMKLAAGGELGMGVGEEDWGSSERDVLEDFARRTEGLVDVMVARFGEPSPLQHAKSSTNPKFLDVAEDEPWLGSGRSANAADGVVFSGLGDISRKSRRDLSHWVESIYCLGEYAYGVRDNPTAVRKRRKRNLKAPAVETESQRSPSPQKARIPLSSANSSSTLPPGIPPPIVKAAENSLDRASAAVESSDGKKDDKSPAAKPMLASLGDTETWVKYMTLGYGTAWGGKKNTDEPTVATSMPAATKEQPLREPSPAAMRYIDPEPDIDHAEEKIKTQIRLENDGYFLIGLKGDLKEVDVEDEDDEGNWNTRIPLRTIHLEVDRRASPAQTPSLDSDETPQNEKELNFEKPEPMKLSRLRPVHRPFVYTFLFTHRTDSLSMANFYRDIHNFFAPLHRSLDKSTSPSKVAARLSAASAPHTTISSSSTNSANTQPIYDLVFDPCTYTVHTSLPNIPDPGTLIAEGLSSDAATAAGWSRIEALNVHSQILATISSTRSNRAEIERTQKTSRGWWVVWMRLPPSHASAEAVASQESQGGSSANVQFNTDELREAFLVRRARDSSSKGASGGGSSSQGKGFASGMWSGLGMGGKESQSQRMGGANAGWGPKGLAEGIGIDARRYVEELLSLNR